MGPKKKKIFRIEKFKAVYSAKLQ